MRKRKKPLARKRKVSYVTQRVRAKGNVASSNHEMSSLLSPFFSFNKNIVMLFHPSGLIIADRSCIHQIIEADGKHFNKKPTNIPFTRLNNQPVIRQCFCNIFKQSISFDFSFFFNFKNAGNRHWCVMQPGNGAAMRQFAVTFLQIFYFENSLFFSFWFWVAWLKFPPSWNWMNGGG